MLKLAAIVLLSVAPVLQSSAQSLDRLPPAARRYFEFTNPSPLSCLISWLPPFFIQRSIEVRQFVRSAAFRNLRRAAGDRRAVDAIYCYAMRVTDNNTAAALLIATAATLDHRTLGIRNPLFRLAFPLSDESHEEFHARVTNLPARIYDDTPGYPAGDRDKLQHFFGSAFLTVISESRSASDRFGQFIEKGEQAFIIGGIYDDRDLRADRQGQLFGWQLLKNNKTYPSRFLTVPSPGRRPRGMNTVNAPGAENANNPRR